MSPARSSATRVRLALLTVTLLAASSLWAFSLWTNHSASVARKTDGDALGDAAAAALMRAPQMPRDTYASVHLARGGDAWRELLWSAGVPLPAVDAGAPAEHTPAALLVGRFSMDAAIRWAREGRVVFAIADAGEAVDGLALPGGVAPLVGVPAVSIIPGVGATLIAGQPARPVISVETVGDGVLVRLGLDLAAWAWRLRQGDPALAGVDTNKDGWLQPLDLMDILPPDLARRPFVDALVARIFEAVDARRGGARLPRLPGLPPGARGLVVLTADQDYASDDLVALFSNRIAHAGARATFLLTDRARGRRPDLFRADETTRRAIAPATADTLLSAGMGLGVHAFYGRPGDLATVSRAFQARSGFPVLVARNHHLGWDGFTRMAEEAHAAGIRLDLNFSSPARPDGLVVGFAGGSGRSAAFIDAAGRRLPIFQQGTTVGDYSLRIADRPAREEQGRRLAIAVAAVVEVAARLEMPVVINTHPGLALTTTSWLDGLLGLRRHDVPIISGEQWLAFLVEKRSARLPFDFRTGLAMATNARRSGATP